MFTGLSAFPITPIDAEGRVDAAGLERLLGRLTDAGVDSIGLLGSTGSYPYLSRGERARTIALARQMVGAKTPLLVGVGALTTAEAVLCARDAQAAGADALLLAPVSYLPLLDDEVFAHFEAVVGAGDLPVCVYNNPVATHFTVSPALLARLAALPNVVSAKNPAPPATETAALHAALAAALPPGFSLGYSVDWQACEALLAGGRAWYSVAAGLFPKHCLAILRAVEAGDAATARRLDQAMEPLWTLFRRHTSYRVVHAAARRLGLVETLPPRPILPLGETATADIAETIETLGLA